MSAALSNDAQRDYDITHGRFCAVVWPALLLWPQLERTKATTSTDPAPLNWIPNMEDAHGMLTR